MFKDDNQLDDFFGLKSDNKEKPTKEAIKDAILKNIGIAKIKFLPKILSKKERYLIIGLLLVIVGSFFSLPFTVFYHYTKAMPDYGGSFSEGIVGEPRYLNPLLSQNNDVDRDLVSLIYSGLMKYNDEGKLVPDLAKSYEISSDGLNYTIYLKENVKWHDGTPMTAQDVVFTIQTAQNTDYGSLQRINWRGVEIEAVDKYTIILKLKNKYAQFLNNLTLNILPQHVWQNVKPVNFALSDFNLKPIGSGPYKFKKLKKDDAGRIKSYELESNKNFYDGRPYIDNIELKFYASEDELIDEYNRNSIENLSFVSANNLKKIKFKKRLNIQELKLPRYFGVFFNENEAKILSDKNIRLALNYGTDKKDLINKILDGRGIETNSPMMGEILDMASDVKTYNFDQEKAKKLLADSGWGNPDDKGVLSKTEKAKSKNDKPVAEKLTLRLTTPTWSELNSVANLLKEQWAKIGVELVIEVLPSQDLQQVIKERGYQMLLFGEILNIDPDPFSLWHSSQKRDPGLNLSLYDNKTADGLLEKARQTLNPLERIKQYQDFQKLVVEDVPAVFLYNPLYVYAQANSIKGFGNKIISMPSDRFSNVEKWYIDTQRNWK
ncbi:MAG: Extracellular solute-binding protein family 5 [Candidatus Yanofskybacteria bacterium GW2011_GWA1_39_13]|uniref:Extracellular solute-binding protein family 5 n=1 Tax=Yanofskybacteria sp. (strain GW2011_GWA1_39_13) TaxID=1619019 RepID=A0A0G0PWE9_YANXG|nr:MAG: Extracellular solute-binding protein family 5 [Candidatus Yanofskybacteria bacterium GW2011_GWA1_39_13]